MDHTSEKVREYLQSLSIGKFLDDDDEWAKRTNNSVCVIKDIPLGTEKGDIEEIFKCFGEIEGIYIFEAKGYAYIHFKVTPLLLFWPALIFF